MSDNIFNPNPNSQMSRRDFIKTGIKIGAGAAALAAWSGLPQPKPVSASKFLPSEAELFEAAKEAAARTNVKEITMFQPSGYVVGFTRWVRKWEKETGIKVRLDEGSFFGMHDKLANMYISGTHLYDVAYTWSAWTAEWRNFYTPLSEIPGAEIPKQVLEDMLPGAPGGASYKGVVYGLPRFAKVMILHYNRALYDKHKLTVPETYEQFLENVKKIHTDEKGNAYGFDVGFGQGYNFVQFCVFTHLNGGKLTAPDGKIQLTSEGVIKGLKDMVEILKYMPASAAKDVADSVSNKRWVQGQVGHTIYYGETYRQWENGEPGTKLLNIGGVALIPGHEGVVRSGTVESVEGYVVPKTSKKKEVAWQLIRYLSSYEPQVALILDGYEKSGGGMPCYYSNHQDDRVKDMEHVKVTLEQWKYDYDRMIRPAHQELIDTIEPAIVKALLGQQTPEQAMEAAQKKCEEIISREKA